MVRLHPEIGNDSLVENRLQRLYAVRADPHGQLRVADQVDDLFNLRKSVAEKCSKGNYDIT